MAKIYDQHWRLVGLPLLGVINEQGNGKLPRRVTETPLSVYFFG